MTEDEEIEAQNAGANICANKLKKIAEEGRQSGVFGGPEIEAAAQAILKLRDQPLVLADFMKLYAPNVFARLEIMMREKAAGPLKVGDEVMAIQSGFGGGPGRMMVIIESSEEWGWFWIAKPKNSDIYVKAPTYCISKVEWFLYVIRPALFPNEDMWVIADLFTGVR